MRHIRPRFKLWPNDGRSVSEVPRPKGIQTPSYGRIQWLVAAPVLPAFPDGAGVCVNGTLPKLGAIVPGVFAPLSPYSRQLNSSVPEGSGRPSPGLMARIWLENGLAAGLCFNGLHPLEPPPCGNRGLPATGAARIWFFLQSYPQSDRA